MIPNKPHRLIKRGERNRAVLYDKFDDGRTLIVYSLFDGCMGDPTIHRDMPSALRELEARDAREKIP